MIANQKLLVIARYYAHPGMGEQVAALLPELAVASRKETENLSWDYYRSLENPDHFVIIERYNSPEGLDKHRNTTHYQKIGQGAIIPLLSDRQVQSVLIPT